MKLRKLSKLLAKAGVEHVYVNAGFDLFRLWPEICDVAGIPSNTYNIDLRDANSALRVRYVNNGIEYDYRKNGRWVDDGFISEDEPRSLCERISRKIMQWIHELKGRN